MVPGSTCIKLIQSSPQVLGYWLLEERKQYSQNIYPTNNSTVEHSYTGIQKMKGITCDYKGQRRELGKPSKARDTQNEFFRIKMFSKWKKRIHAKECEGIHSSTHSLAGNVCPQT